MQQELLERAIGAVLGAPLPPRLGVAVSGGGDSIALLHLLAGIYAQSGVVLEAVTVDHGLRTGAAAEAKLVAVQCAQLGIPHETLKWQDWDGRGNLQDAARQARYGLMAGWAQTRGLEAVALGHTADDQAETVLLRLARRSGVDGLAGMAPRRHDAGILWLRPLLQIRRASLRSYLDAAGISWSEDPSNDDTRFDRIKARQALAALADMGIDVAALSVVADNMSDARAALEHYTAEAARACVRVVSGAVCIDRAAFCDLPTEVQRRLVRRALDWIAPSPYPPRRAPLTQLTEAVRGGTPATLHGCALVCRKGCAWIFREYNAVTGQTTRPGQAWDGRWRCVPLGGQTVPDDARLAPLSSNGLKQCDNWRDLGLPRGVLLSHPALWHGDTVISSPAAKTDANWGWELVRDEKAFFQTAL